MLVDNIYLILSCFSFLAEKKNTYINRVSSLCSVQLDYHNLRFNILSQPTLTLTLLPTSPLPLTIP